MAEWHDKCSYYPDCKIHLGQWPSIYLSDENVREVKEFYNEKGLTMREIARAFGVHPSTVARVLRLPRKVSVSSDGDRTNLYEPAGYCKRKNLEGEGNSA